MAQRDRVLVVDDDTEVREALLAALNHVGYVTASARDGQEALAWMQASLPDLVLADVQMPRMGGIELIQALRARGFAVPVVLLTGANTRDLVTAALSYGASACLTKPVPLDELVWTIDRALVCGTPDAASTQSAR